MDAKLTLHHLWLWCIGFFVLAGLTGSWFRFSVIMDLPGELSLSNIRHTHSHLMFFNWVVPVPMLIISHYLIRHSADISRQIYYCIAILLGLGTASFPFFLFYGYQAVQIGQMNLPLSVMLSGLVMIMWYWFMFLYFKNRDRGNSSLYVLFFESSLVLLAISSFGAWGVAIFQFSGADNPLIASSLTHFFLTVFTEGWTVLVMFGSLYYLLDIRRAAVQSKWLVLPIFFGVPLMFPLGMPESIVTADLLLTARVGAAVSGIGILANIYVLAGIPMSRWWKMSLIVVSVKVILQLGAAILPSSLWLGEHSLRIFYLHTLLLGFITMGIFSAIEQVYQTIKHQVMDLMFGSIFVVLFSLLMLTSFWPAGLRLPNIFTWIAIISILPVIASGVIFWNAFSKGPKEIPYKRL